MGFVTFAWKNIFLQHAENCANTSVFARCCPKNSANTVVFATRSKTRRKYRGFGLPRRKKHRYLFTVFFAPRVAIKTRKHHLFDDFRPLRDWEKSCRGNNNNSSSSSNNNSNSSSNNNNSNSNSHSHSNSNSNRNSNSTVVFGLWGAKNMEIRGIFCPEGFLRIGLTQPTWPLVGPCAHHRHHQQRNDSKHLSFDSFVSLFFAILLWWRILHRYVSTNRQRYAQKPLHSAAFMRRYSCTERFVHR